MHAACQIRRTNQRTDPRTRSDQLGSRLASPLRIYFKDATYDNHADADDRDDAEDEDLVACEAAQLAELSNNNRKSG